MKIINRCFQHNWLATIYINFKMLPWRQAIKFPIDIYHKVRFESLSGKIEITTPEVHRGMIKIGAQGSEMFAHTPAIIDIKGVLIFKGIAAIGCGSLVRIEHGGTLTMGDKCRIGARCKVFCTNKITLGNEMDISWESQVFDTNFHYMQNVESLDVVKPKGEVSVGDNCWIGNRVNLMRGAVIPNNTIVASNSLVNKDFSDIEQYSMLAGSPAKVVKTGVRRLFEGVGDELINKYKS